MAVMIILMIIVLRQGSSLLSYFILTTLYSQKYFDVHLLLKSYTYFFIYHESNIYSCTLSL